MQWQKPIAATGALLGINSGLLVRSFIPPEIASKQTIGQSSRIATFAPLLAHSNSSRSDWDLNFEGLSTKEKRVKKEAIWSVYLGVGPHRNMREIAEEDEQLAQQFQGLSAEKQVRFYVFQKLLGDQAAFSDVDPKRFLSEERINEIDALIEVQLQTHKRGQVSAIAEGVLQQLSAES